MSAITNEIRDIPAALPFAENDEEREKLLRETENENQPEAVDIESDDEETESLVQQTKPSKKKLFLAFVVFVFGFVLLVLLMSWFFGIGVFAAGKTQTVDRTAKKDSANQTPVSEEEKLKMALNMVAEKNPTPPSDQVGNPLQTEATTLNSNSSVDLASTKATDLSEPIVLPDSNIPTKQNDITSSSGSGSVSSYKPTSSYARPESPTAPVETNTNSKPIEPIRETAKAPIGRTLFFGVEKKQISEANNSSQVAKRTISPNSSTTQNKPTTKSIPFGSMLPIRFLGAVYTLRSSGGLVRMELTRKFSVENIEYPAGTVIVGTLRGSEFTRAFISITGLIDPKTGGLVKFQGEVLGADGASGVIGRRRQVKSAWSRVFGGFRDAGAVIVNGIGNRRSGGTVVISDSATRASGVITDELSGLVGEKGNSNEFVEIAAGTTGFVLVTDLPEEVSATNLSIETTKSATGLAEAELADLFSDSSDGSSEKLRAAMPRMTPEFRKLAEKVLKNPEK
jgi:hypothetical protein